MDDKWLVWPENIAIVLTHYIIVMWDNLEKAKILAKKFEKMNEKK